MNYASDIEGLRIFPFLDSDSIINELKIEYLATAEDIPPQIDKLEWWKKHEHKLPHWSQVRLKKIIGGLVRIIGSLHKNYRKLPENNYRITI